MSEPPVEISEDSIKSIIPLLDTYLRSVLDEGFKQFDEQQGNYEWELTDLSMKRGASGIVYLTELTLSCSEGQVTLNIALKYFEEKKSAIKEFKNAMELEVKFRTAPEFGTPNIIFASTQNPILLIYEGIDGTNYDEIELKNKPSEAGRLLATIHGPETKPVNAELYQNLIRVMGGHLQNTGFEEDINRNLRRHYEKMENANSGCDPFSDYHQSNVMLKHHEGEILKAYVIDPEFMQEGQFDRLEDVGTFFGNQMYEEYLETGSISNSLMDLNEFLVGYEEKLIEMGGPRWVDMYPNHSPLPFFIAQWALMDALDYALNRNGNLQSDNVTQRIKFSLFVLQTEGEFKFPTK